MAKQCSATAKQLFCQARHPKTKMCKNYFVLQLTAGRPILYGAAPNLQLLNCASRVPRKLHWRQIIIITPANTIIISNLQKIRWLDFKSLIWNSNHILFIYLLPIACLTTHSGTYTLNAGKCFKYESTPLISRAHKVTFSICRGLSCGWTCENNNQS